MRGQFAVEIDIVLSQADAERRDVERDVQDAKKDQRKLGRHGCPKRCPVGLSKVLFE